MPPGIIGTLENAIWFSGCELITKGGLHLEMCFEFFWEFLTVLLKSTHKLVSSMCSISLPRSAILLANPNGSNRFEDVKPILFEFVTLGFTLAISKIKIFL